MHTAKHENEPKEYQIPLTEDDIKMLPEYMVSYDDILEVKKQKDGSLKAWFGKKINGHSIVITTVSKGRKSLTLKTAYLLDTVKYDTLFGKKKEDVSHREANASNIDTMPTTSKNVPSTKSSSNNIISQDKNIVNDIIVNKSENNSPLAQSLEALSQNNEPISLDEVKKATGFGDNGAKLVTELASQDGMTFDKASNEMKVAYLSGYNGEDRTFTDDLQNRAKLAGIDDRIADNNIAIENAKNATVYEGVFTENEYTKNFTKAEKKMISTVAKGLKMDVSVVDKIIANVVNGRVYEANAEHKDGKMRISSTTKKVIHALVMHEGGHRMKQLAPTEFGVLMDALYERTTHRATKAGVSGNLIFDNVKAEHNNAGITMETSGYLEEFAARELETIFSSAREFNRWYAEISGNQQVRTNFEKFIDWIYEVIDDIKRAIKQATMTRVERAKANEELDRIKELLASAYKAAENAAIERMNDSQNNQSDDAKSTKNLEIKANVEYNENVSYSLFAEEVIFSSRYNELTQSQSIRELYDSAKKGDAESAYNLLSRLLGEEDINKVKSFGNDVHLLPIVGAEGTSTNVLPKIITKFISVETDQNIFSGIYKENSSNSRKTSIWARMKENYPSFALDKKQNIKTSDI